MSVGRTLADYVHQLKVLLPVGPLWTSLKEDSVFKSLIESFAVEFQRIDTRSVVLCDELDPRTATEIFDEWWEFAGLPDPCVGEPETLAEKRAAVVAKLTNAGGQSRQFFIDLAASIGYTITITEYDGGATPALIDQFYWQVNAAAQADMIPFRVTSTVDNRLRYWPQNTALECLINRLKPAHTVVIFSYT